MGIAASKNKLSAKLPGMPRKYAEAMSDWLGADVSRSDPVKAYAAKITPAVADKWEKNTKKAFGL